MVSLLSIQSYTRISLPFGFLAYVPSGYIHLLLVICGS